MLERKYGFQAKNESDKTLTDSDNKADDDLQWARSCARASTILLSKKPRTGLKR